uniref:Uncharacterized protein n=1 Tax=Rhizophora mucronata TaxID=61149 RepID=A0A2P2IN03_RHIMU
MVYERGTYRFRTLTQTH